MKQLQDKTGYEVSEQLKELWLIELDILEHLLDVCKQHNLRVWADGGTLLGTIRHHGFIPWDDDIDVCMPRPDYDRLIELGGKVFAEPYFLQSAYSDKDYFRGHAQLRRSDTAAIRPSEAYRPFNQGIFIDIFPLDGVETDEIARKNTIRSVKRTHKKLKAVNLNILYSGRWLQIFRKINSRRLVKEFGWKAIFKSTEDLLRQHSVDDCEQWAELAFSGDDIIFNRHIFNNTIYMPFEYLQIPVPEGYDEFLRTQYGDDYMTPLAAQSYHGELIIDTKRSYQEIAPQVNRQYRQAFWKRIKKAKLCR